jgi:hypothetical protein
MDSEGAKWRIQDRVGEEPVQTKLKMIQSSKHGRFGDLTAGVS